MTHFYAGDTFKPGQKKRHMVFNEDNTPRGPEEIENATDCTFGAGSCVPCECVKDHWYVLVSCTLPHADTPVPESDPV